MTDGETEVVSIDGATPAENSVLNAFTSRTPDGRRATLVVGVQTFRVGPEYDSLDEVDWIRWMLAKAILSVTAELGQNPDPIVTGGELDDDEKLVALVETGGFLSGITVPSAENLPRCPECGCCALREDGGCSGAGEDGACHLAESAREAYRVAGPILGAPNATEIEAVLLPPGSDEDPVGVPAEPPDASLAPLDPGVIEEGPHTGETPSSEISRIVEAINQLKREPNIMFSPAGARAVALNQVLEVIRTEAQDVPPNLLPPIDFRDERPVEEGPHAEGAYPLPEDPEA